jgi:ubiquinone/menaquinone biosynthesis C-methylase UbiE
MREHMNSSARDSWQQPKAVIQSLNISPGALVADLGAGGGYFTFGLAEAVGPEGRVYAVDIDRDDLEYIARYAREKRIANVEVVQAVEDDPRLPEQSTDLIFTCNTAHHLSDRAAYFRSAVRYLRPHGRVAIIDYTPTGFAWLFGHATAKEVIRQEMETAGYRLIEEFDYLSKQHFQVFRLRE